MKYLLLLLLTACVGCSTVQNPYFKETTTNKDGSVTVREYSADQIKGGNVKLPTK